MTNASRWWKPYSVVCLIGFKMFHYDSVIIYSTLTRGNSLKTAAYGWC